MSTKKELLEMCKYLGIPAKITMKKATLNRKLDNFMDEHPDHLEKKPEPKPKSEPEQPKRNPKSCINCAYHHIKDRCPNCNQPARW